MVLLSIQSTETDNGYRFSNDFAEALVIDPNASVSLINVLFERKDAFVVTATNNQFAVRLGTSTSTQIVVTLDADTYSGTELATEISDELNTLINPQGYYSDVIYDKDLSQFKISSYFHKDTIAPAQPTDMNGNIPYDNGVMNTTLAFNTGTNVIDASAVADKRPAYQFTNEAIESNYLPNQEEGGSFFEFKVHTALAVPAGSSRAWVGGLWSNSIDKNAPLQPGIDTELGDNANLRWLDAGIVLQADQASNRIGIKIIENGVDIGFQDFGQNNHQFTPANGDSFMITLYKDAEHPKYWYKRNGGHYHKLPVGHGAGGGNQTFTIEQAKNLSLYGIFGTDTPQIASISDLKITPVGQNTHDKNFIQFEPGTIDAEFGTLIGYTQLSYVMSGLPGEKTNEIVSDHPPLPDAGSAHHPILHLNINNLPLHSIVGQKYNSNATLDSNPIGSRNGVTRLLAQFPRYHQVNGVSAVDKFGPFYYDYFPYSVRLGNAHSINLNELQVTLTNVDGTLASDITDCKILLNITNEENVGGHGPENIGLPRVMSQTEVQRNTEKNQLEVRK